MSRKPMNADDFDLSLTGSQISAASSGRRPNSSRGVGSPSVKRPSSAGSREKVKSGLNNRVCKFNDSQCFEYKRQQMQN